MTPSPPTRRDDARAPVASGPEGEETPVDHTIVGGRHRRRLVRRRVRVRGTGLRVRKAVGRAIADSMVTRHGVGLLARVLPPARVSLTRYEITLPRLPRHLDGLRVLHLTDLHLHPGSELAWQLPELVARVPHDLTCYTGDFINIDADIPAVADLLAHMPRAEGEDAYAVLGNHDYVPHGRDRGANDVPRLRRVLEDAGLIVLANNARPVRGGGLWVVGVDDPATGRDDLARAMAEVPADACALVLAHSPDVALRLGAPGGRRPDLILAGHTHGGQIRLPRLGPLITLSALPRALAMGLGRYDDVPLFVSRGIGYSTVNLRLGTPPEAALLTLRAPKDPR